MNVRVYAYIRIHKNAHTYILYIYTHTYVYVHSDQQVTFLYFNGNFYLMMLIILAKYVAVCVNVKKCLFVKVFTVSALSAN